MQTRLLQRAFQLVGVAALACSAAYAQTDVALNVYGAFNGTTTTDSVAQSPANAAGVLLEVRHISHPWFGYEGTYAYNRANQGYSFSPTGSSLPGAEVLSSAAISTNAHEVTADYVASMKIKLTGFRPFALVGGGLLLDVPSSGRETVCQATTTPCSTTTIATSNSAKPVFVYGGGVDWTLLPHIGLRLQYRGNLYKAPDLTNLFTSTNAFTHTAEPMIGIFFRL
jgi:hypothetical protein